MRKKLTRALRAPALKWCGEVVLFCLDTYIRFGMEFPEMSSCLPLSNKTCMHALKNILMACKKSYMHAEAFYELIKRKLKTQE